MIVKKEKQEKVVTERFREKHEQKECLLIYLHQKQVSELANPLYQLRENVEGVFCSYFYSLWLQTSLPELMLDFGSLS